MIDINICSSNYNNNNTEDTIQVIGTEGGMVVQAGAVAMEASLEDTHPRRTHRLLRILITRNHRMHKQHRHNNKSNFIDNNNKQHSILVRFKHMSLLCSIHHHHMHLTRTNRPPSHPRPCPSHHRPLLPNPYDVDKGIASWKAVLWDGIRSRAMQTVMGWVTDNNNTNIDHGRVLIKRGA